MHFTLAKCSDGVKIKIMEKILFELSTERDSPKNGCNNHPTTFKLLFGASKCRCKGILCCITSMYMVNIGQTFYDWRPYEVGNFQETFRDFCSILPSENYFSVLLRMIDKHKSACLCTVLAMYDQKYTKLTRIGNYYRIVTKS